MASTISPHHLEFLRRARVFRDELRNKGKTPMTFRDGNDSDFIALFMENDDIHVFELGFEVAYFTDVTKKEKETK